MMEVGGRGQIDCKDIDTVVPCDPCLFGNENTTANSYCADCSEFLCDNCSRSHRNSKATRHHIILGKDKMPKKKLSKVQETFCFSHVNKKIEYFCKVHNKLCCSVCVTIEHSECGVLYIDDLSREFDKSQEYQNLLEHIEFIEKKLTETKEKSEKKCKDAEEFFTTLISDVKLFRTQFNTKLDELERKVMEEAQKIKSGDLSYMESILTQCETIQQEIKEISSTLECLKSQKQNQQLFLSAKKYLKKLEDRKEQTQNLSLESNIRSYLFLWNEEILQNLDSCCKLFHLNFRSEERPIQALKNIESEDSKETTPRLVKRLNIQHRLDKSSECLVTGSALLNCDTLALADNSNFSVKIVELHTDTVISSLELTEQPRDLTCIDSNTLVVTCGTKLTFLKLDRKLLISKEILMDDVCHGITSHQNKLFVTFLEQPSIKILSTSGTIFHTIQTNSQGQNLFGCPEYITLGRDGQTIYVSNKDQRSVTSLSLEGDILNVYKHKKLGLPRGLTMIGNNSFLVCGCWSDKIYQMTSQCKHIQIVLDRENLEPKPTTVLYNSRYNTIYISFYGNNFVHVFELE